MIIVAVLAATVVLVGSVAGVVAAQTKSGNDSQPGTLLATDNTSQPKTLLARVAAILGIEEQKVENAFFQAEREMQSEALDRYLADLVNRGKITKEQADQYKKWWQSRPDMSQYRQQLKNWQQARPGIPPELTEWEKARPDIPLPGPFGRPGFGDGMEPGGMKRGGGPVFPGW